MVGCAHPPSRHFRVDAGEREVFLSFCEVCATEVPENVPIGYVLNVLEDRALDAAEVMVE